MEQQDIMAWIEIGSRWADEATGFTAEIQSDEEIVEDELAANEPQICAVLRDLPAEL